MGEFTQAVSQSDLWKGMQQVFAATPAGMAWGTLKDVSEIPSRADQIAEEQFPDSARDASRKNAFRHALGTGMLTQKLGGNALSAAAAKGIGYVWEGLGHKKYRDDPEYRTDTRHDLNANAIGAREAMESETQERMIQRLKTLADASRKESPPLLYEASPGYLTQTVR